MIWINAPHFCAGVVITFADGIEKCTRAAPIVGYMRGWPRANIEAYCRRKGWSYQWTE